MNKSVFGFAGLIVLVALIFVGYSATFTVNQTEYALLLRFGEPVPGRAVVKEPGLHFKAPFIENVVYFDNRILDLETPKQEVLASDNNRIEVDAFLRYRITDILQFYRSVRTINGGNNQLASILNSAVRRVLGEATMVQLVRDDRSNLMRRIRDQVNQESTKFGVEINDVRIRRADLPRQISEQVFRRMQTERAREAADYRAQGAEQAQRITSKADRDVVVLRAEAQRQADQTRGEGDAERNRVFNEAFGKDPGFFGFYRSMQAYEAALKPGETRMVISPNTEFFRYFNRPSGVAAPASGSKPSN
ncbi:MULTISPECIES: protease modulator HflC [unclassified Beijerinckia]|uniref:protease modulator HflC n=1 Tax=unclassified Beijerinckia TaxID=2638183 RepID=UPI00089A2B88|nr:MULTISPECIES: protease modulator HflC [unclassified Beijerinckia]MDH7799626.1 membrane protease subunit HflC [Beijerinckia sp. GAS462]SEB48106.1 membrane protease subunit HflC [Beijerinckia sp. 28-YEA-48]